MSTNQIVSHHVNHFVSQNHKVQIDYPITLIDPIWHVQIDKIFFVTSTILKVFFDKWLYGNDFS